MARLLIVTLGKTGGPSDSLLKLLPYLRARHDVRIWVSSHGGLEEALRQARVPFRYLRIRYCSIPSVFRTLKRERIDAVYANHDFRTAWRVLIAAKLAHCRFIWHIRSMLTINDKNPLHIRRRVRYADQVIAVSEACGRAVRNVAPRVPVAVVHNGVDPKDFRHNRSEARRILTERFHLPGNSLVIVSTGTLNSRKNQCDAVRAVHAAVRKDPRIYLLLMGEPDPGYLPGLEALIEKTGLRNRVRVTGFQRDVGLLLRGSDIYIHTALVDPHPRAVVEALGAGLPVVAYDVDGIGETVVDGRNGFLVPAGNVAALEKRILGLAEDPALRAAFSRNARIHVRRYFTTERTADGVLRVIDRVLRNKAVD